VCWFPSPIASGQPDGWRLVGSVHTNRAYGRPKNLRSSNIRCNRSRVKIAQIDQTNKVLLALKFELMQIDDEIADSPQVEEAIKTTFGIERDLQSALRSQIAQLEPGLKITDGGKEKIVASGRIDITAEDVKGAAVVIELKAGEADRDAIGQILGYMGDMSLDNKAVRGILVAGGFAPRAIAAARVVPNLRLEKYSFNFVFTPVS
jgi:RecB family endonuclease NucS